MKKHENQVLWINEKNLTLQIVRSKRRKRSIALIVKNAEQVTLHAPFLTSHEEISTFLNKHERWLITKLTAFAKKQEQIALPPLEDANAFSPQEILEKFTSRTLYWCEKINVMFKDVKVTQAKTRWGSCSADNVIRLNKALIRVPEALLDYVIVHELCHIPHKNHSAVFWKMVAQFMPDFHIQRKMLNHMSDILL